MKKKSITVLLMFTMVFLSAIGLCSCGHQGDKSEKSEYTYLSEEKSNEMIKNASKDNVIIVDSRGREAWEHGHIKDSIPMEMKDFDEDTLKQLPDKNQKILIY